MNMNPNKVFVDVVASFDREGRLRPLSFTWEDGRRYEIDRITHAEQCASRRVGGVGMCYSVWVEGKECHLFYEFGKWFMERR